MRFQPELEGLRGIAVALVVLFHARLLGMSGGFVGVDAFYVLSGFLITGLLLKEVEATGRLSLVAFYTRRARRILPAATIAIIVVLAACAFVVAPLDLPTIAVDATASGLFAGNVVFALRATDYFASATPSPFLHYWSLGVEEQFYLLWPLFVLLAFRWRRLRALTIALCLVSLGLAIALTPLLGAWAFYGLPTRAWQLAMGALLAMYRPGSARHLSVVRGVAGWVGLVLLGLAARTIDATQAYPGAVALLPTVAVALVIRACDGRGGPGTLLALAPLRWLGRVSFSLYLYHWPVLVLATMLAGDLSPEMRWSCVAVSVVVAAASRAFVEEPFLGAPRSHRAPRRSFALAASGITVVIVLAQLVGLSGTATVAASHDLGDADAAHAPIAVATASVSPIAGPAAVPAPVSSAPALVSPAPTPTGPRELRPRLIDARGDADDLNKRGCGLSLAGSTPPACELGVVDGAVTVALVGDSHAAQWFPALDAIAWRHGWRLHPFTKDSCIFLDMRIVSLHLEREYTECARWRENVVAALTALQPDLVVVSSSRWVHPVDAQDASATRQTDAMVRLLARIPGRLAIIADTPLSAVDVPACLSRRDRTFDACATARDYALTAHLARDGAAAELLNATLIDPSEWLCDATTCPAVIDWTIVYRDDHHLTATMAARLAPLLEPGLRSALSSPRVPKDQS